MVKVSGQVAMNGIKWKSCGGVAVVDFMEWERIKLYEKKGNEKQVVSFDFCGK